MKNKFIYYNSRALFCGIGLSNIIKLDGNAFWLCALIGLILGSIIIFIYSKLNQEKTFKKITNFIICIYSTIIIINGGSTLYLENTPALILIIFIILCIYLLASFPQKSLFRLATLLFPVSICLFIIKEINLISLVDLNNLRPILNASTGDILLGSLFFAVISTTPVICLNDIKDTHQTLKLYLLGSIMISIVGFVIIAVLGVNEAKIYRYPEYIVLKRITILNFINNVDDIFSFILIIDLLITSALSLKNTFTKNKTINIGITILLGIIINLLYFNSSAILFLYHNMVYILMFLLILSLFPKKNIHKIRRN